MSTDLTEAVARAIALEFEGHGEAWTDDSSGDRLALIAAETAVPIIRRQVAEQIARKAESRISSRHANCAACHMAQLDADDARRIGGQ